MYLTRMPLDVKRRSTMKAMALPNMIHGAVESAFPGERKRNLWRLDCLNGKWYLLLVSEAQPDLTEAARQFGDLNAGQPWEAKDYTPLLERIQNGSIWHFRLTANPTVSTIPRDSKADRSSPVRGKPRACAGISQQEKWLTDRAPKHGFEVEEGRFDVVNKEWIRFQKQGRGSPISILSVTYEGILRVTDRDLFTKALMTGIGRGKAYGMGMLTIANVKLSGVESDE